MYPHIPVSEDEDDEFTRLHELMSEPEYPNRTSLLSSTPRPKDYYSSHAEHRKLSTTITELPINRLSYNGDSNPKSQTNHILKSSQELASARVHNRWFFSRWLDRLYYMWNPYADQRPQLMQLKLQHVSLGYLPAYGYVDWDSLITAGLTKKFMTRDCWFDVEVLVQVYQIKGEILIQTLGMNAHDFAALSVTPGELISLELYGKTLMSLGMDANCKNRFRFSDEIWLNKLKLDPHHLKILSQTQDAYIADNRSKINRITNSPNTSEKSLPQSHASTIIKSGTSYGGISNWKI